MKGVIFSKQGAAPEAVDTLTKPEPGEGQVLVKSLWVAINPVDGFMANTGILVLEWPLVLAVDAGGVIVSAHPSVKDKHPHLTTGTHVFGCTRLGKGSYAAGQEYHLMDAALLVHKPDNITTQQACTLGVSTYTAGLGLFHGLGIALSDTKNLPAPGSKGEWVVVQGGASSVGKAAVQMALATGYKVIASCSPDSNELVQGLGAGVEVFSYRQSLDEQVERVLGVTGGKVFKVFDAVAGNTPDFAQALFKKLNEKGANEEKRFTTTNDWTGIQSFEGAKVDLISLGPLGRSDATELNAQLTSYAPVIHELVKQGKVTPSETLVVGDGKDVWNDAIEGYQTQSSGKGGSKKVVVKLADE